MNEPLVSNAGDKKQVKAARAKELRGREREIEDMRFILKSRQGRRFLWRLMGMCRVFGSVYDSSGSRVYFNAGQQDIGHMIMTEVIEADEYKLIEMMKEEKEEANG